jgi:hypothetical protein
VLEQEFLMVEQLTTALFLVLAEVPEEIVTQGQMDLMVLVPVAEVATILALDLLAELAAKLAINLVEMVGLVGQQMVPQLMDLRVLPAAVAVYATQQALVHASLELVVGD